MDSVVQIAGAVDSDELKNFDDRFEAADKVLYRTRVEGKFDKFGVRERNI